MSPSETVRLAEPEFWMAQPFEVWAELRKNSPVSWSETDEAWIVTSHADIKHMSMNPHLFGNRYGFTSGLANLHSDSEGVLVNGMPFRTASECPGDMPRAAELRRDQSQAPFGTDHIVIADPPRHTFLRKIVSTAFSPRSIAKLEEMVHRVAVETLDQFSAGDEVNLVDAIACPVPTAAIAYMLGVPPSDQATFTKWSDSMVEAANAPLVITPEDGMRWQEAFVGFRNYFIAALDERRARPREDLLTAMLGEGPDGEPLLTVDDQVAMALTLLGAGNETTRGLISGSAYSLWQQPDQRRMLIEQPDLLKTVAIEELLRYQTPVTHMCRTALEDTEVGGTPIAKGDFLVMVYQSANRDEAVWDNADQLLVDRPPVQGHLAFGFAEHFCLGSRLARHEARVVLNELLMRFPNYEVVGDVEWYRSVMTPNPAVIPVLLK